MMSLEYIRQVSREKGLEAARQGVRPFVVEQEDIDDWKQSFPSGGFPFPFIGDHVPAGWEEVDSHFVDSSGFGRPGEPALTAGQFLDALEAGYGYAITEAGQFQVYVGKFRRLS